jgi:hypothetical protein
MSNQPSNERTSPEARQPRSSSRRQFLTGALVGAAVVAAGGGTAAVIHQKTRKPDAFNNNITLNPLQSEFYAPVEGYTPTFSTESPENIKRYLNVLTDKRYLGWLVESMHKAKSELSGKQEGDVLQQSLRVTRGPIRNHIGYATATQIDAGGVYLTARHVIKDAPHNYIDDPYTNRAVEFSAAFIHPEADIALIVAPTGQAPQPISGLYFASEAPSLNERLTLDGLISFDVTQYQLYQYQKSGNVSQITPQLVAVNGLVPLGGTSGGPVTNNSGGIVGVESGNYNRDPAGPNEISNYEGSVITPIAMLGDVSQLRMIG